MNSDQVKGRVDDVKGKIKEGVGDATNNDRLKTEGQADQVGGKAQAAVGDLKEKAKDVIDKV
jgi:uncharacterized protein YjbJ (UPF0337 family)